MTLYHKPVSLQIIVDSVCIRLFQLLGWPKRQLKVHWGTISDLKLGDTEYFASGRYTFRSRSSLVFFVGVCYVGGNRTSAVINIDFGWVVVGNTVCDSASSI